MVHEFEKAKEQTELLSTDYLHGRLKSESEKAASLARKSLSSEHEEEKAAFMGKVFDVLSSTPTLKIPLQSVRIAEKIAKKELMPV